MAAFVFFESFAENLAKGVINLHSHTLKGYLSNTAPNAATHDQKADIAEISTGNGYTGPIDVENAVSRSGDTVSVDVVDKTVTADSGTVGPFRYFILFDDDAAGDELVGYWDRGDSITLQDGESVDLDFTTDVALTIAPA